MRLGDTVHAICVCGWKWEGTYIPGIFHARCEKCSKNVPIKNKPLPKEKKGRESSMLDLAERFVAAFESMAKSADRTADAMERIADRDKS